MSSRSLGSEPRESQGEAGPEGDAADAGATRGAPGHAGAAAPARVELRRGAAAAQLCPTHARRARQFCARCSARADAAARAASQCWALSPPTCGWCAAPGAAHALLCTSLSHFGAVALRRLPTSLRWASTSSRSTCASPSPSSSPPRCGGSRAGSSRPHALRQTRWPHALTRAQGRIRDTAKTAHMCKCVSRCRAAPSRCAAAAPKR